MFKVCEWYEVVVFTASLSQYANPVIDLLDPKGQIKRRLFREVMCFREWFDLAVCSRVHLARTGEGT